MKLSSRLLPLLLGALLWIWTVHADAQFGGFGGGGHGGRGGRSGSSAGARSEHQPDTDPYQQIGYRLSVLEQDLKLSPQQLGPWQQFAGKVLDYAGDQERERAQRVAASGAAAQTGLQQIGQAVDLARNRWTALEEIETAAKGLYAALTPEQSILADLRIAAIVAPRPDKRGP